MSKGGVDLVAMDDVSMLTNYAHSDWLIGVSVRDLFIEILYSRILCCHIQIKVSKIRLIATFK